jgi:DNA polymerase-3 subunit epsilon
MREIVFDTETTGFEPGEGHRIVEIGLVELMDHYPTGRSKQFYLNPEREVPIETQRIHGLSTEFLSDKPLFAQVVEEFLDFVGDAVLVIHNASFDMKFINAELIRVGKTPLSMARTVDTIEIAKRKIPGARYSLDELCKRFNIDLSAREKHGALLDAELTAQVYLELVGGRQRGLALAPVEIVAETSREDGMRARQRPHPLLPRITAEEIARHAAFIAAELGDKAIWALASLGSSRL